MSDLRELIEEVYVDPIRSVLIVDDEFVSLDRMIGFCGDLYERDDPNSVKDELVNSYQKFDFERAKKMVYSFRENERSWLCDIHDGRDISSGDTEAKIVNHLHQSDLLILDYNLTGDHDDGSLALSLIGKISQNSHFNLVVIYTNNDINTTFLEVLHSLISIDELSDESPTQEMEMNFNLWKADDDNIEGGLNNLFSGVAFNEAVNCIRRKSDIKKLSFYQELLSLFNDKPEEVDLKIEDLFLLGFSIAYNEVKIRLKGSSELFNEAYIDSDVNWIKNSRLFVTVIHKNSTEPEQLIEQLSKALCSWNPKPLRLLMSKIRTELDGYGIGFEDSLLSNDYVLAGWLRDFLSSGDVDSKWVAKKSIQQVMMSLSESLQCNMLQFINDLKTQLSQSSVADVISRYHNLCIDDPDVKILVSSYHNANVCSKEITGNQLKTGHVLKCDDKFFLCLTPACDLVPSQSNDWKRKLGDLMPIKLVSLFDELSYFNESPKSRKKLLEDLNGNNFLVLDIEGDIKGFSWLKTAKSNPQWEQAFALDKGALQWDEEGNHAFLNLIRVGVDASSSDTEHSITGLPFHSSNMTVVAELRYEYALNFLQKFGLSQSRVGLDFLELGN